MRGALSALAALACTSASHLVPAAVAAPTVPRHESFITLLGVDTVAAERFVRTGDSTVGDFVFRSPSTWVLHYEFRVGADGNIQSARADLRDSSSTPLWQREMIAAPGGFEVRAIEGTEQQHKLVHSPPTAIPAFFRALAVYQLATSRLRRSGADSIRVPTLEFDTIGLDSTTFRRLPGDSVWINMFFPRGEHALVDGAGRILGVSGMATSYKWTTTPVPDLDIAMLERSFAARDAAGHGLGDLSGRGAAAAVLKGAHLSVDYGRPSKRGRAIFGALVPWDQVWRTGADDATQLTTDKTLSFGGLVVPPGTYSLYTIPSPQGWTLIVNRHTHQSGLLYFPQEDLGRVTIPVRVGSPVVERLRITIAATPSGGVLRITWDDLTAEAAFTVLAPALAEVLHVDHEGAPAREPMLVEHPSGALFVSGYGGAGPTLWKSTDHGASWVRVDLGSERDGAIGNSDVDLAVARDGTLYFVAMGFDRSVGEGTSIAIGVSKDVGATWHWTALSKRRFDDRPWVAIAPDGVAHVIWNDGQGICHAVSRDAGATWQQMDRVTSHGGSSHLAIGPRGVLAVRVIPISASGNKIDARIDSIALSTDGGSSWTISVAPGDREWPRDTAEESPVPRWVEPLAWDSAGALYSLWTNREGLWLARSTDAAKSWTIWPLLKGGTVRYYPYLVARGDGQLAASWTSGFADSLRAHVATITLRRDGSAPFLMETEPFTPESWGLSSHHEDPAIRQSAGEYFALLQLRDGRIALVSPIQNERLQRYGFSWLVFEER